jgi:hypothetical protein
MAPMIRASIATYSDTAAPDLLSSTTKEIFAQLASIVETVATTTAFISASTPELYSNIVKLLHLQRVYTCRSTINLLPQKAHLSLSYATQACRSQVPWHSG